MRIEVRQSTLSLPSESATAPTEVNFARSEIGEVVRAAANFIDATQPSEPTDSRDLQASPSQVILVTSEAVEAAYNKCKAVWSVPGSTVEQTKWSKRSVSMISAALRVVTLCKSDPNAVEQFRALAKKEGNRDRAPNKKSLELLALQLCLSPKDPKHRRNGHGFQKS